MKPKNLLVDENDDCAIKLADFGFAARVYEPCSLTKQCGTPFFIGTCHSDENASSQDLLTICSSLTYITIWSCYVY